MRHGGRCGNSSESMGLGCAGSRAPVGIAEAVPQACARAEGDSGQGGQLGSEAWDQGFGGREYSSVAGGREREASEVSA